MSSICVTESVQSRRMLDALDLRSAQLEKAEADLAFDFIRALEAGEPYLTPEWTGTRPDSEAARKLGMSWGDKGFPRRANTVGEAFLDSLDYPSGPDHHDLVRLLSLAMKGNDPTVALAARQLVERCASVYARHNAEEA